MSDGGQRGAWVEAAARLWPGTRVGDAEAGRDPSTWPRGRPSGEAGDTREFVFLPNARRPRMLVPAGSPRVAANALRLYSHGLGVAARAGRSLLAAAAGTGLPERFAADRLYVDRSGDPEASIERHLGRVLGDEVAVSLRLGNPRANRKPVLHAMTPGGRSLAFVKVGDTDVARALVDREAAALARIDSARRCHFAAPRVLHHGDWQGLRLLVLSPLETSARRWKRRETLPLAAMGEVAALDDAVGSAQLADSAFWRDVTRVPEGLSDREAADRLAATIARAEAAFGGETVRMGPWHGDWTPWNMAWSRDIVCLWDWERFSPAVPYGFDPLHYRLQGRLREAGPRRSVLEAWSRDAAGTLEPLGVTGRAARATVSAYLVELCCRYLAAAEGSIGDPVRPRARWLLDFTYGELRRGGRPDTSMFPARRGG